MTNEVCSVESSTPVNLIVRLAAEEMVTVCSAHPVLLFRFEYVATMAVPTVRRLRGGTGDHPHTGRPAAAGAALEARIDQLLPGELQPAVLA
jgi:hypothetical protein